MSPKMSFFAWEAIWGKVLALDWLKGRGWLVANRYFLYLKEEELADDILLRCGKNQVIRCLVFFLFEVSCFLISLVRDLLSCRRRAFVGKKRKKIWQVVPLCLFLTIWKERNWRTFDAKSNLIKD